MWQIPDAVDTVECPPGDEWRYHRKHVEQFPDINKLCKIASFGYTLEYVCYTRTHKRQKGIIACKVSMLEVSNLEAKIPVVVSKVTEFPVTSEAE